MKLTITHQGKPTSSVVYGPRHLSCEISSVGLFHNVLTGNVLVLQKLPQGGLQATGINFEFNGLLIFNSS